MREFLSDEPWAVAFLACAVLIMAWVIGLIIHGLTVTHRNRVAAHQSAAQLPPERSKGLL